MKKLFAITAIALVLLAQPENPSRIYELSDGIYKASGEHISFSVVTKRIKEVKPDEIETGCVYLIVTDRGCELVEGDSDHAWKLLKKFSAPEKGE